LVFVRVFGLVTVSFIVSQISGPDELQRSHHIAGAPASPRWLASAIMPLQMGRDALIAHAPHQVLA
jgi:hypothetical protein